MGRHAAPRNPLPLPKPGTPVQDGNDRRVSSGRAASSGKTAGPVTAAFRVAGMQVPGPAYLAACSWPAVPALLLAWPALHGRLMLFADGVLGFDATLCLMACLLITPVVTVAKAKITRLRWWYGIWVFIIGAAALLLHLAYPPGGGMPVAQRMAGTAVNWSGLLIVVLLLPMAATSSTAAQKLLGPEWKRAQRNLVWAVWAAVGIHFALMHSWLVLAAYGGGTVPAMLLRFGFVRRSVKKWRGGGYSTGGWWTVLAVLASITLTGFTVITTLEVIDIASALA